MAMRLSEEEKAMRDGAQGAGGRQGDGPADPLRGGARRGGLRLYRQHRRRSRLLAKVGQGLLRGRRRRLPRRVLALRPRFRRSRRRATDQRLRLPPAGRHGPRAVARAGHDRGGLRQLPGRRARRRRPRHPGAQDLHALPRRQRAGDGRALRVDGIERGGVLQLGHRRAHQLRRAESTSAAMLAKRIPNWGFHTTTSARAST